MGGATPGRGFVHLHLCLDISRGLRRLGLPVDMLAQGADLAAGRLVPAPGLATPPEGIARARVILGPRAGAGAREFRIPVPPSPRLPGHERAVALVESLPPGAVHQGKGGGRVRHRREEPEGAAEGALRLAYGRAMMMPAAGLRHLGGWPDAGALGRIPRDACAEAGIATLDPTGRVRDAGPHRSWLDHGPDAVTIQGIDLPPAGVHRENRA